jgi:hypothetical protein
MVLTGLAVTLAMILVGLAVVEVTVRLAWLIGIAVTPVATVVVWLVMRRRRTAMIVVVCTYALGRHSYINNDLLWSAV